MIQFPYRRKRERKLYLRSYPKGWLIFVLTLGAASLICALLQHITSSDVHVPMIFVLAVLIVSLSTDGYFYGLLAAIVSVIGVNYAFTYPYMKLDFSVYGYPLTFMTMLAVGFACSTLASHLRMQEQLRLETEREHMRANLLRALSHDLRTPLTSISGSITTVLDEDEALSPDMKRELLAGAKRDAEWLCRMVENLLSVTRISGENSSLIKRDELKELLPRLFDGSLPLSGSSRSDGSRFMGIGLSVCRTIIEAQRVILYNLPMTKELKVVLKGKIGVE